MSLSPLQEEINEREHEAMVSLAATLNLGCTHCNHYTAYRYRQNRIDWCREFGPEPEDALIDNVNEPMCGYECFWPNPEGEKALSDYREAVEYERYGV